MSEQKFLRPANGVKVRRPDGAHLAESGETVTMTSYWQRRLAAGDVVEGEIKAAETGRGKANRE